MASTYKRRRGARQSHTAAQSDRERGVSVATLDVILGLPFAYRTSFCLGKTSNATDNCIKSTLHVLLYSLLLAPRDFPGQRTVRNNEQH